MENLDIKSLTTHEVSTFLDCCSEKISSLKFQLLKLNRKLFKQREKIHKWQSQIQTYQQRIEINKKILELLPETRTEYQKFRLDILKCDIWIDKLWIRIKKYSIVRQIEDKTKITALESQIRYYEDVIAELNSLKGSSMMIKRSIEPTNIILLPPAYFLSTGNLLSSSNMDILERWNTSFLHAS